MSERLKEALRHLVTVNIAPSIEIVYKRTYKRCQKRVTVDMPRQMYFMPLTVQPISGTENRKESWGSSFWGQMGTRFARQCLRPV